MVFICQPFGYFIYVRENKNTSSQIRHRKRKYPIVVLCIVSYNFWIRIQHLFLQRLLFHFHIDKAFSMRFPCIYHIVPLKGYDFCNNFASVGWIPNRSEYWFWCVSPWFTCWIVLAEIKVRHKSPSWVVVKRFGNMFCSLDTYCWLICFHWIENKGELCDWTTVSHSCTHAWKRGTKVIPAKVPVGSAIFGISTRHASPITTELSAFIRYDFVQIGSTCRIDRKLNHSISFIENGAMKIEIHNASINIFALKEVIDLSRHHVVTKSCFQRP